MSYSACVNGYIMKCAVPSPTASVRRSASGMQLEVDDFVIHTFIKYLLIAEARFWYRNILYSIVLSETYSDDKGEVTF